MEAVAEPGNPRKALARVQRNEGALGIWSRPRKDAPPWPETAASDTWERAPRRVPSSLGLRLRFPGTRPGRGRPGRSCGPWGSAAVPHCPTPSSRRLGLASLCDPCRRVVRDWTWSLGDTGNVRGRWRRVVSGLRDLGTKVCAESSFGLTALPGARVQGVHPCRGLGSAGCCGSVTGGSDLRLTGAQCGEAGR